MKKLFSHGKDNHADEPTSQVNPGLTGEGSHLAGGEDTERHPIYDQFSKTSGEPTKATEGAPHFSNTANLHPTDGSTQSPSVRQDSTHRPGQNVEAMSTASIKSGVLGFGQGKHDHAARDTPYSASHHGPTGEIRQDRAVPGKDYSEDQSQEFASGQTEHNLLGRDPPSKQEAHLGRDAALGAGAGGLAAQEYTSRREENVPTTQTPQYSSQAPQSSHHEPKVTTESDRSFPLAGGVTGRRTENTHSNNPTTGSLASKRATEDSPYDSKTKTSDFAAGLTGEKASHGSTTNPDYIGDRDLDTKNRETTDSPYDSRKGLAGAAGAAGLLGATAAYGQREHGQDQERSTQGHAASGLPIREKDTQGIASTGLSTQEHDNQRRILRGLPPLTSSALPTREEDTRGLTSSELPTRERDTQGLTSSALPTQAHDAQQPIPIAIPYDERSIQDQSVSGLHTDQSGPRDHALSGLPTEDSRTPEPEKRSGLSGLLFTTGPHKTDTANRTDPHLHIPGEFPEPTPLDEPAQPSFDTPSTEATTGGLTDRDVQEPSRATETLPTGQSGTKDEHHYGRDAALGGGVGAAGLGAYEAGKHHSQEATDIGGENIHSSPYSSSKIDPRVHGKAAALDQQRYDPTARTEPSPSTTHHSREAAKVGGLAGGAGLLGHEASKHQPNPQEAVQPSVPSTAHHDRDTATTGGLTGGAGLVDHEASKHQPTAQENIQPTTTSHHTPSSYSQTRDESTEPQHHYGRDAGLAGAGAATAGGLYYASQRGDDKPQSGPASETIGPHKSNVANVLDPRIQPDPALQKHHERDPTTTDSMKSHTATSPHQPNTLGTVNPNSRDHVQPEQQHHHGRDAAVVGGTGAAGLGAYEAAKTYGDHRSTQPSASMNEQRYDPTAPGAHAPQAQSQHHYGRDAAVGGGALAAGAGTAAYLSSKDQPKTTEGYQHPSTTQANQQPSTTQGYQQPSTTQAYQQPATTQGYQQSSTTQGYQQSSTTQGHHLPTGQHQQPSAEPAHQRYDSVQDPNQKSKQNVAFAGAAGVAGTGAAYGLSQHEQEKAEQERLAKQQKEQDKAFKDHQKELEKKQAHDQKELEKKQAHDQKHAHKAAVAEDKHLHREMQKAAEKAEKKHEKEEAKAEKKHEKEEAKAEKKHETEEEPGKKKHHLFGFLHRDKKKGEADSGSDSTSPRHSKEYAAAGAGAGVAGATAYEQEHGSQSSGHERNRLHKDPPPGHPAREAMEHQHDVAGGQYQQEGMAGKHEHRGTDGPIGDPTLVSGVHTNKHNPLGAQESDGRDGVVTEPHTGLPMNVGKYGSGQGGTDGSETVSGYHGGQGQEGTDGEGVKKTNVPY